MSYATPTNFLARYDARRVGELVKDDATRATPAELLSDTTLQAMLDDAASMIDAACLSGKRYTLTELAALTGSDAYLLIRLNCDLAWGLLLLRRGGTSQDITSLAPGYAYAMSIVDKLWNGEWVFNVDNVPEAGLPEGNVKISTQRTSVVDEAYRYYGDLILGTGNGD